MRPPCTPPPLLALVASFSACSALEIASVASRRAAVLGGAASVLLPKAPAFALTAEEYDAGIRLSGASGGRGANALLKTRAESGVVRTGLIEDPLFKSGTIFDQLKNADGSATDVTFTFPERGWVFSRGPNLDVRNVQTSDSAFLLVAKGKNVDTLKKKFFTDVLFDPAGKYGAYGTVDDFSVTKSEMLTRKSPSGKEQAYRRLSIKFAALTYNQNTLERRAEMMATEVGGSIYMLCAGCQARNYKASAKDLDEIVDSFRAVPSSRKPPPPEAKARDEDDEFKTAEEYAANKGVGLLAK